MMHPAEWATTLGPFGAFLAFLTYMLVRDRRHKNENPEESKHCPLHRKQLDSILQSLAETTGEISKTQAVQAQILNNMQDSLKRIERKVGG